MAIETGSIERGLGQEKCVFKDSMIYIGLTDTKNGKVIKMLISIKPYNVKEENAF